MAPFRPMNYETVMTWLFVAICVVVLGYLGYVVHIVLRWF
jgi:preprotein translocase subunit Sss1